MPGPRFGRVRGVAGALWTSRQRDVCGPATVVGDAIRCSYAKFFAPGDSLTSNLHSSEVATSYFHALQVFSSATFGSKRSGVVRSRTMALMGVQIEAHLLDREIRSRVSDFRSFTSGVDKE
jgi:hypothetical protein